ncbi:SAM-dependent methyltransferase [Methylobrevis pamukkalensis]|uniref:Uncharacterized protein n=1 Tax=Methylobrevis pamukkalensis TaxID=1439726 RepID=A0A1E3GYH2_9HYPH|nr:hypothetical protein [Methylobrevis pamukkalensis]ODN69074.1 hypothetical protein A6302_03612 [Methylobrevis pamukkalensis]
MSKVDGEDTVHGEQAGLHVGPATSRAKTPPCPLTGGRSRLVQRIPPRFLADLWRIAGRTDISGHYGGIDQLGLYRSDCGLHFFHPMIAGSADFYEDLYSRWRGHDAPERGLADRQEYLRSTRHVRPGDRVLDVGCGRGGFASHLGHAEFTGLDPHAVPTPTRGCCARRHGRISKRAARAMTSSPPFR